MLLAASVCLMVQQQPHINRMDQQVELFALSSLAMVTHISSLSKPGVPWLTSEIVLTCVLFLLPVVTLVGGTAQLKKAQKKAQKRAEEIAHKEMADLGEQAAKLRAATGEEVEHLVDLGKRAEHTVEEAGKGACRILCCKKRKPKTGVVVHQEDTRDDGTGQAITTNGDDLAEGDVDVLPPRRLPGLGRENVP